MVVKPFDKSLLQVSELPLLAYKQETANRLRDFFEHDEDVYVFNQLYLESAGEMLKIDHLVLSRWGICQIGHMKVNKALMVTPQNDWRKIDEAGVQHYIPAPTAGLDRSGKAILHLLNAKSAELLPHTLGMRRYFGTFPIEGLVAVAESTSILRDTRHRGGRVVKCESLMAEIVKWLTEYRVRGELRWLLNLIEECPMALSAQSAFDIAYLLQAADARPSELSPLLLRRELGESEDDRIRSMEAY